MELFSSLPLAIGVILLGAGLLAVTGLSLRWLAARRPAPIVASPVLPLRAVAHEANDTGVLVVETGSGGRLLFVNERARQFFGLDSQTPNLERLARQVEPPEALWELIAAEGRADLTIGDWRVEATSLSVPPPEGDLRQDRSGAARMVVVLRETRQFELVSRDERAVEAVSRLAEIGQAMAASLELPATLEAILAGVGRIFPYNIAEITLWDEATQTLRPARYAGDPQYEREFKQTSDFHYTPDEGFSGWLVTHRQPLVVGNIETFTPARPKLDAARTSLPLRSYLGAPLMAGPQLLGTLELVSYQYDAYQESDLTLFNALAGQAAVAIQNAQWFALQERRVAELTGLAEITRAIESTADTRELYGRLTANIARLLDVEIAGFALYDEAANALVGQAPFYGIPDFAAEIYRLPLRLGSAATRLWRENEFWLSNHAATDPLVDEVGLRAWADTVSLKTSLLIPIVMGERRLGVVHVGNKNKGALFADQDVRLLITFAGQAAAILDNARLVRQAQHRAEQAEGLRQIAAAIAASTSLDDILRAVMRQTAALLRCDTGVITLLDETRGELIPHPASVYGGPAEDVEAIRLRTDDPAFALSVTRTRRPFLTHRALRDRRISALYRGLVERYQMNSILDVPLVVGDKSLGEMIVSARQEKAFTREDLQLLSTVASQLASAIERVRLYAATDQNLRRRVDQLTALTRVGRELNQTLELERILRSVHDEAVHTTQADCGTIVLLDLNPSAGSGQAAGPEAVALRLGEEKLGKQLTALEVEAVRGEPLARRRQVNHLPSDSPLAAHADLRSALIVPIQVQGQIVGLIHMHSRKPEGFDEAAEEAAVALAAQAAIAVENARRFEEQRQRGDLLRRRADQLAQLFQISRAVRTDRPPEQNLESIAFGLQEAVGFNQVVISVLDPQTHRLKRTASAGVPLATFRELQKVEQPWESVAQALQDEFRISQSYLLPGAGREKAQALAARQDTATPAAPARTAPSDPVFDRPDRWHPDDMLIIPLRGSRQEAVGLLSVDDPRDGLRPDRSTIEIIEIFANQAALAIQNYRLYQASERRAARLLALHRVIEHTTYMTDRSQIWQAAAEGLQEEMGFDVCVIVLQEGDRLVMRGRAGLRPEVDFPSLLTAAAASTDAQQNPDAVSYFDPVLVFNTREGGWHTDPLVIASEVTSFINAPILSRGQPAGLLFVGSRRAPTPFAEDDLELLIILTNQLGGALESARLEADIRQRAAQLAALADVSQTITSILRTGDVVHIILTRLGSVVPYDSVTLWLREGGHLRIAAAQGFENDAERLGLTTAIGDSALFAEMAEKRGAILVPDVRADARFLAGAYQPTRSWLGAPLVSKGQIIGVLALDKLEANAYTPQSAQVLAAFANQAAVALDNARLFEEREQRARELDERSQRLTLLNRVSAQLGSQLNIEHVFDVMLNELIQALGVESATAVLFNEDGQPRLSVHAPDTTRGVSPFDPQNPVWARMQATLAPFTVEDVAQDPSLGPAREPLVALGIQSLLFVPLVVAGKLIGAAQIEEMKAQRRFTPSEIELAQIIANQAGVAVQNARLYAETETRLAELETINHISRAISATIDVRQLYELVGQQVTAIMGVDNIFLMLYDELSNLISFPLMIEHGQPLEVPPRPPGGLSQHVIQTRKPLLLRGSDITAQLQELGALNVGAGVAQSWLGAPLLSGERVIGVIAVQDLEHPNVFNESHQRVLTTIAAQVAVAVENARFAQELEERVAARTQELQRERERVETLLQITTELSSSLDLDRVLARALELVTEAVNAPQGSIFLMNLETDQLIYRAALGRARPLPPGGEVSPVQRNEGLVGWMLKNRQAAVIGDLDADPRWKQLPHHHGRHKSAIAVPLMANEDALGAMILLSPQYNAFDEAQLRLVAAAANQVGAAINNAELYRLIRDQAERLGGMLRGQQVEATKSRAILEGIADGVLVTDADGKVILFNRACERVLGIRRDKIMDRSVTEFVGIYGKAGQAWITAITRWSLDPDSYRPGEFFSERLQLEDERVISVHLAPVTTSDEYLGSVSVIRDITREVEVDRLKSEFVTNVSHELRTPMTSIKGYADVLLLGAVGQLTSEQAKFVEVIKSNADRLSLLVNDLLDISRIESGKVELTMQAFDIGEILREVADTLNGRMDEENKPLTLQIDAPPGLPAAWGDRKRVTQILMNLADNAFNYTHAGGAITLRACVDEDAERDEIRVEVTDTGVGVPPEDQPRLFDRFYRGEDALVLARAGTGLGLPIARQLAEMHGGRLWLAASEAGRGSTFALALPLTREKVTSNV